MSPVGFDATRAARSLEEALRSSVAHACSHSMFCKVARRKEDGAISLSPEARPMASPGPSLH
eukprot:4675007-Pyramimonas_sp.AAC.1